MSSGKTVCGFFCASIKDFSRVGPGRGAVAYVDYLRLRSGGGKAHDPELCPLVVADFVQSVRIAETITWRVPHFIFQNNIFDDVAAHNVVAGELVHMDSRNIMNTVDGVV